MNRTLTTFICASIIIAPQAASAEGLFDKINRMVSEVESSVNRTEKTVKRAEDTAARLNNEEPQAGNNDATAGANEATKSKEALMDAKPTENTQPSHEERLMGRRTQRQR